MAKPYELNTKADAKPLQTRDTIGRYARPDAGPQTPLEEEKPKANKVMDGWAPGIAQNSAETDGQRNPYPPIEADASVPKGGFNVK